MIRLCNYICYSLVTFSPLFILFVFINIYFKNYKILVSFILLFFISVLAFLFLFFTRINISFLTIKSMDIAKYSRLDLKYSFNVIFFINIILIDTGIMINFILTLSYIMILYSSNFSYRLILMKLLGYNCYVIDNIYVYSKKSRIELVKILKKDKYLQGKDIYYNIFIEFDTYNIKLIRYTNYK